MLNPTEAATYREHCRKVASDATAGRLPDAALWARVRHYFSLANQDRQDGSDEIPEEAWRRAASLDRESRSAITAVALLAGVVEPDALLRYPTAWADDAWRTLNLRLDAMAAAASDEAIDPHEWSPWLTAPEIAKGLDISANKFKADFEACAYPGCEKRVPSGKKRPEYRLRLDALDGETRSRFVKNRQKS